MDPNKQDQHTSAAVDNTDATGEQGGGEQRQISRRNFLKAAAGLSLIPLAAACGVGNSGNNTTATTGAATGVSVGSGTQQITILQTTDIHGQITTHPEAFWENGQNVSFRPAGSYARIAKLFKEVQQENPGGVIIVDTGDFFQGSAITGLSQGEALTPLVNAMPYDMVIPGNWEFAYGSEQMQKLMKSLNYPTLCANMYKAGQTDPIFKPYMVKEVKGARMGFLGYTDDLTPKRQAPSNTVGLDLKAPIYMCQEHVNTLRNQEKSNAVFLMTHVGLSKEVAQSKNSQLKGVDYILGSHTHERVRTPIKGQYSTVVEPGAFGSFVGRMDLFMRNGEIKDVKYQLIEVKPDKYEEDPDIARLVEQVRNQYKDKTDVVHATTKSPLYRYTVVESTMDNFIADAIKTAGGTQIGISNAFRFTPPIMPGNVTEGNLWDMLPVNAQLKRGNVTGQQMKDWWEQELENVFSKDPNKQVGGWVPRVAGMEVTFTAGNDKGNRVKDMKVNGERVTPGNSYSVTSCRREGAPEDELCRFEGVKDAHLFPFTAHDALRNLLRQKQTIDYKITGQIKATDLKPPVLSQVSGTDYKFS